MESENPILKFVPITSALKTVVIVIPIIVGALFFAGTLYLAYYYMYWGLSLQMFPMSFQTTVVYGAIAFAELSLKYLEIFVKIGFYVALFFIVLSLLGLVLSKVVQPPEWFLKISKTLRRWFPQDKAPVALLPFLVFILATTFLVFVLALFRIGFAVVGEDRAREQHAELKIERDDGILPNLVEVKFVSDVRLDESLRRQLIVCAAEDCAFLLSSGVEVVSRSNILSITGSSIRGLPEKVGKNVDDPQ